MQFVDAVEQYTEYLLKLSYLYVKDRPLAEDIVQEVFIKLYEKYGDEVPLQQPKSYLVQMTVNRCRDYFRSWHYRKIQVSELFQLEQTSEPLKELGLMDEVWKLPLKYREVVILYYYDDQSTTEIAQLLNLPVSTVKTRLQRGRHALKGLIEEGGMSYEQQV